jgi:hypothetical protein
MDWIGKEHCFRFSEHAYVSLYTLELNCAAFRKKEERNVVSHLIISPKKRLVPPVSLKKGFAQQFLSTFSF